MTNFHKQTQGDQKFRSRWCECSLCMCSDVSFVTSWLLRIPVLTRDQRFFADDFKFVKVTIFGGWLNFGCRCGVVVVACVPFQIV